MKLTPATPGRGLTATGTAIAITVGLVLADSSIVVLALPEIYRELDVPVSTVVWVLIAFNLVLGTMAVPAARAATTLGPARLTVAGLAVFGVASLACGIAPSIEALIAARCVQAAGGAAAVCASLELLPAAIGSERRAVGVWAAAGATGAALGPGVGGLLTELISWQSIFLVQVPVVPVLAVPLIAVARREARAEIRYPESPGRPHLAANLALGVISAALAAALFLVVLLLIEGWRLSPAVAAAAVSVMPGAAVLAAPLAAPLAHHVAGDVGARAAAGVVLVAGGLAALGLLPRASIVFIFPPQVLIGVGLALTLSALTEAALAGRPSQAIHGGWTIAARHVGVVVGLVVLTPLFTADLETQRENAEQAGASALLDAPLAPVAKIELGARISDRLREEEDRVPILRPAFEPLPADPEERDNVVALRATIEDEVDRAATHAFSRSFLVATALALAALLPIGLTRRRVAL
jgi:MFS family permease